MSIFIDSDSAMGSPLGDVDDAFAVTAILKSGLSVCALASVFGNTTEPLARQNLKALAGILGFRGEILRGAERAGVNSTPASEFLVASTSPIRLLAIGPLTNIATALQQRKGLPIQEIIAVTTNWTFPAPALRFFDFNQSQDRSAFRMVVDSATPLTLIPCDVARHLRVTEKELAKIEGPLGDYFRHNFRRWFLRARMLKLSGSVPIWDLVAALYVIDPTLFLLEKTQMTLSPWGRAQYGVHGGRPVTVVTGFRPQELWERFFGLMGCATMAHLFHYTP